MKRHTPEQVIASEVDRQAGGRGHLLISLVRTAAAPFPY